MALTRLLNHSAKCHGLPSFHKGPGYTLGSAMSPSDYVLQVIVTDPLAKEKHRVASQWIDFEIVK